MSSFDAKPYSDGLLENNYPIVYTVVTWVRILTVVVCLAFGVGWTYMTFYPPYAQGQMVFNPALIGIDCVVVTAAIYGLAWALTAQITLYADRFEQRKPLKHRVLRIADISGRRYTTGRGAGYPVIVPKSGMPFSIDTSSYGLDDRFKQWFLRLPDLQQIAREQNLERIKNDTRLGTTTSQRIATDAARQGNFTMMGGCLTVAAVVTFLASISINDHLGARILVNALLPLAALLLALFYKDQANAPGNSSAGVIVLPIYMPVILLGVLAVENARLMDSKGVIIAGFVMAWVLLFVLFVFLPKSQASRNRMVLALVFLPFAWLYGGSVLALGNCMLDGSAPHIVPTQVVGKYSQRGKNGRSYYLEVGGWAGRPQGTTIRVEGDQYVDAKKGEAVCMALYQGRFGFPWMRGINCPGENGPF